MYSDAPQIVCDEFPWKGNGDFYLWSCELDEGKKE